MQPFLALALGLMGCGHEVRLGTLPAHRAFVENLGVAHFPVGIDVADDSPQDAAPAGSYETLRFMVARIQRKRRIVQAVNLQALAACQGSGAVISRISPFLDASSIAEKLHVPYFEVGLDPQTRTGRYPHPDFFPAVEFGTVYNLLTHVLVEQVTRQIFWGAQNRFRRDVLGLEPYPLRAASRDGRRRAVPILYAFSTHVVPRPKDWPAHVHVTGYWFLGSEHEQAVWPDLADFLESGPPPVYVGFGSMANEDPDQALDLIFKALMAAGQRGVVQTARIWHTDNERRSPGCLCLKSAPHSWLFPRVTAAVHHGGAGTTAASLRAGTPTVIIPHHYDQPFWGKRVALLGAGPRPIPRGRLTVEKLANAICAAVYDREIKTRASALGEKIRSEDGLTRAISLVNQWIS